MKRNCWQKIWNDQLNNIFRTVVMLLLLQMATTSAFSQTMLHRWSFTNDVTDSIGGADGSLIGDAYIQDGAVVLDGNYPTFVDLPRDLVTNLTSFTFETWVTWNGGNIWQRIFDFGNSTLGPGVPQYEISSIIMTPSVNLSPGNPAGIGTFVHPAGNILYFYSENFTPNPLPPGFLHHLVWTYDQMNTTSTLYLDGNLVSVNPNQTRTPADVGPTDNCWLGHSQYFLDPDFNGSISEFRIYEGALSAATVSANYTNGPDMSGWGSLAGIRLLAPTPTMRAGTTQQLDVAADFQNVSNLQFTAVSGVAYQSTDTNVLTVSTNGLLISVSSNTATADIIASYQGMSATQTIQVVAFWDATLLHRYSFVTGGSDSVGTADAILQGNATISNGVVVLNGNNSWIKMPPNFVDELTNLTFEFWLTWSGGPVWQHIFDFGGNFGNLGAPYGYAFNDICLVALDGYQATDGGGYLSLIIFNSGGQLQCQVSVPPLTVGVEHQLVWTLDDLNSKARIFVDGVQAGEGTMTATFNGFSVTSTNNWLAESQFHDSEFTGTIDDLRIYNNALSPQTIAAHYTAGPNARVSNNLGALQDIYILGKSNMLAGLSQQLTVFADYQNASNIVVSTGLTFQASSPSTLSITPQGLLTAFASVTTNVSLTAIFQNKSNSLNVQVIVPPAPNLVHRYSFTSDASDSIGGANGTLMSNAVCSSGTVVLNGNNSWVQFPPNFVTNLTDLTFEFWLTWNGGPVWQHIFDFGDNIGNYGGGYGYALNDFCLVAEDGFQATDGGGHLALITFTTPGFQHSQIFTSPLTTGVRHHVAWTYNYASTSTELFVDGALADYNTDLTLTFSGFHDAPNCWLAQSQFNDSQYNGSIDEFRIYDGALSAQQVALNHTIGPDLMATPVQLSASVANGQITISWPVASSSGYSLQGASSVTPGATWGAVGIAPTVVSGRNQVTLPATNSARFFRLIQ
jgi:hypothetical protein